MKNKKMSQSVGPLDKHIGSRLKHRRCFIGMSQEKIAEKVDLSVQQIQKYEAGVNRISASRLYEFGKILDVDVGYFYFQDSEDAYEEDNVTYLDKRALNLPKDVFQKKETYELLELFFNIKDSALRQNIMDELEEISTKNK